ncbi:hypothetical protein ACFQZT_15580 [Paenibacillus sp. GCM10027628]|uniref:hypothetical protein n=1 Tax=Paenibacillus sp. GCM10027628 TaxID=3273413 RepID=UPI0036326CA4
MKKEELITLEELSVLLAENGEALPDAGTDEPIGAQHLISLQKAVVLLSRKVETLQDELHEHFLTQQKQQEQLLRQFKYQLEQQLGQQLAKGLELQRKPDIAQETELLPGETVPEELTTLPAPIEEPQPTYSRVKSYRKIRKRRKSFLEKLFE